MLLKQLPRLLAISALMGMNIPAHADQSLQELEGYVMDNAQAIVDASEDRAALQRQIQKLREEKQDLKKTVDELLITLNQHLKYLQAATTVKVLKRKCTYRYQINYQVLIMILDFDLDLFFSDTIVGGAAWNDTSKSTSGSNLEWKYVSKQKFSLMPSETHVFYFIKGKERSCNSMGKWIDHELNAKHQVMRDFEKRFDVDYQAIDSDDLATLPFLIKKSISFNVSAVHKDDTVNFNEILESISNNSFNKQTLKFLLKYLINLLGKK